MNPNHLTRDELVSYAAGVDMGEPAQQWIDALVDALAGALDEIKQLETDLKTTEDALDDAKRAEEAALDKANEFEEKYLEKCVQIDDASTKFDELRAEMQKQGLI